MENVQGVLRITTRLAQGVFMALKNHVEQPVQGLVRNQEYFQREIRRPVDLGLQMPGSVRQLERPVHSQRQDGVERNETDPQV